ITVPHSEPDDEPEAREEPETPSRPGSPALSEEARQLARRRYQHVGTDKPSTNFLEYAYWLLPLTFIPLAISLLQSRPEDTVDRLVRSVEKSFPAEKKPAPKQPAVKEKHRLPINMDEPIVPAVSLDDLIARLPDGRIEGAFLPRKTW